MKASRIAVFGLLLAFSGFPAAASAAAPACQAGPGQLCLNEGRFRLEAAWSTPGVGAGSGRAVQLTRDTGYFWFFDDQNVELMVKVLDGRALNRHFWVFYGSLSNVAWTLTVTDTVTGRVKTYENPAGQLASHGDTAALPSPEITAVSGSEEVEIHAFEAVRLDREALPVLFEMTAGEQAAEAAAPPPTEAPAEGPCAAGLTTAPIRPGLCLNAKRFEVEVSWVDPFNHTSGVGRGVALTNDSGYFWFFHPDNVELVVKMLDGRDVNGKFWLLYGALTNVEYTLRVRTFTGTEQTYRNPPFQFLSRADIDAFEPDNQSCGCPAYSAPVCGTDGRLYGNDCETWCHGWVPSDPMGSCWGHH